MFQRAFFRLMPDTVTITPYAQGSTASPYPGVSLSTADAVQYRARYLDKIVQMPGPNGDNVPMRGTVYIASTGSTQTPCPMPSVITLPDGDTHPVHYVERFDDQFGLHHQRIYVGFGKGPQ